jgi:Peptidase propeptide and YPEB domain
MTACVPRITERIYAGWVKVPMKPIARSVMALILATSWTPFNLWAQQSEAELLKQARVTKHQAKKIALARVKHGTIKSAALEKENGVLIWSFDVAQPGKKDLTEVWIDATTGKITLVDVETPLTEKKEVAEDKVKKWLSHHNAH